MRALIVEDDPVKGRRIKEIFDQESCTVDIVEGASDCLDRLRDVAYEIVVLDLLIPWESGILDDLPDRKYSSIIIKEIGEGKCKTPGYLLGITQDPQAADEANIEYARHGWKVVRYENDVDWKLLIKKRIQLANFKLRASNHSYDVEFIVVAALQDPEVTTFLEVNPGFAFIGASEFGLAHYRGLVANKSVLVFCAPEMGVAATACLVSIVAERHRPRMIVMCGIAAAIDPELKLGDVVIADKVWDYASGKITENSSIFGKISKKMGWAARWSFKPSANMEKIHPVLGNWIASLTSKIGKRWWAKSSSDVFNVCIGPVACGPWVVGNRVITDWLLERDRKFVALEMELYGLYLSPKVAGDNRFKVLGIKGISDFADPDKNSNPQARSEAATNSAKVFRRLVELGIDLI